MGEVLAKIIKAHEQAEYETDVAERTALYGDQASIFPLARNARQRRFDAWMVYSEARGRIIDYLGSHEELAVDLDVSVAPNGGIRLVSGGQRLYAGPLGIPVPLAISGVADVIEWFDDELGRFRITVDVRNKRLGRLFGYRGTFDAEWPAVVDGRVPAHVLPVRQERRD